MTKTIGTPEILGAILSHKLGDNTEELKRDAVGFIHQQSGVDLSNNAVHIVQNSEAQIHLALPYYHSVDEQSASNISDSELHISGGTVDPLVWQVTELAASAIEASGDTTSLALMRDVQASLLDVGQQREEEQAQAAALNHSK